jgi:hypothetical protein
MAGARSRPVLAADRLEKARSGSHRDSQPRLKAITVWWLNDLIVPAVLILGGYCFVLLVRSSTRRVARRNTRRTAEDLYPRYADSLKKQRKYAREHGGTWKDNESQQAKPGHERPRTGRPARLTMLCEEPRRKALPDAPAGKAISFRRA